MNAQVDALATAVAAAVAAGNAAAASSAAALDAVNTIQGGIDALEAVVTDLKSKLPDPADAAAIDQAIADLNALVATQKKSVQDADAAATKAAEEAADAADGVDEADVPPVAEPPVGPN